MNFFPLKETADSRLLLRRMKLINVQLYGYGMIARVFIYLLSPLDLVASWERKEQHDKCGPGQAENVALVFQIC